MPIWQPDRPFPIDVENLVQDTLEAVRPKLKHYTSFEEASAACTELEAEFKPKIGKLLKVLLLIFTCLYITSSWI